MVVSVCVWGGGGGGRGRGNLKGAQQTSKSSVTLYSSSIDRKHFCSRIDTGVFIFLDYQSDLW